MTDIVLTNHEDGKVEVLCSSDFAGMWVSALLRNRTYYRNASDEDEGNGVDCTTEEANKIVDLAPNSGFTVELKNGAEFLQQRMNEATGIIAKYGSIDGVHHKKWVIDAVARCLLGNEYHAWVADIKNGEDGPDTYPYDEGISP